MGEVVMYDRKPTEEIREIFSDDVHTGYNPLFAFGDGLSYTSFAYSDLKLNSNILKGNQTLTISVAIKNTGARDGKHTVELYTRDMYAPL